MKNKILLFLITVSCIALHPLDVRAGRIKLSVNEQTGHFSAFYLRDMNSEEYLSFFFEEDPRTTKLIVNVNNRVFTLGESYEFQKEISEIPDGIRIVWTSSLLQVTQEMRIIRSSGSQTEDGIHANVVISNISERNAVVGLKVILDTHLGEASGNHFFLSTGQRINGETGIMANMPSYIVSPLDREMTEGIQIMSSGAGITKPDSLILANWKRLNDSSWEYTVNSQRTFSNPPYSINDSAVLLVYSPRTLATGNSQEINMAFGYSSAQGFSPDLTRQGSSSSASLTAGFDVPAEKSEKRELIRTDLLTLRDFLNQIDSIIESGEDVPEEKMYQLEQILKNLESGKNIYTRE